MCTVNDAVTNIGRKLRPPELVSVLQEVLMAMTTEMGVTTSGDNNDSGSRGEAGGGTVHVPATPVVMTSPTVDLFNVAFRNNYAVNLGLQQLETALDDPELDHMPLSWGNTNLVPKFYRGVLDLAYRYQRPVKFIRWGKELPSVSLTELYTRNIRRFLACGRYVPLQTMSEFLSRANTLLHVDPGVGLPMSKRGHATIAPVAAATPVPAAFPIDTAAKPPFAAVDAGVDTVFTSVDQELDSRTETAAPPSSFSSSSSLVSASSSSSPLNYSAAIFVPATAVAVPVCAPVPASPVPVARAITVAEPEELAILAGYRVDSSGMLDPVPNWNKIGEKQLCRNFLFGSCVHGKRCRYAHVSMNKQV